MTADRLSWHWSHSALGPLDSERLDSCIYSPIPNTWVGLSQILSHNRLWSCHRGPSHSCFPVNGNGVVSPCATPCLHSRSHCSPAAPATEGTARRLRGWSSSSWHSSFPRAERGQNRARIAGSSPQTWSTRVCKPPRAVEGAQSPEPPLRAPGAGGERAPWAGEFPLAKKTFRLF